MKPWKVNVSNPETPDNRSHQALKAEGSDSLMAMSGRKVGSTWVAISAL